MMQTDENLQCPLGQYVSLSAMALMKHDLNETEHKALGTTGGGVMSLQTEGDMGSLQESQQLQENADNLGDPVQLTTKMPPLVPASMWTRKDLQIFKDTVKKCADNVIRIGSLATATVSEGGIKVPPHYPSCMLHSIGVQSVSSVLLPIVTTFLITFAHFLE